MELLGLAALVVVVGFVVSTSGGGKKSSAPATCGISQAQVDSVSDVMQVPAGGVGTGLVSVRILKPDVALGIWKSLASQGVALSNGDTELATVAPTHDGSPVDPTHSAQAYASQKNIGEMRWLLVPVYMAFDVTCTRFLRTPADGQGAAAFAAPNSRNQYAVLALPGASAALTARDMATGGATGISLAPHGFFVPSFSTPSAPAIGSAALTPAAVAAPMGSVGPVPGMMPEPSRSIVLAWLGTHPPSTIVGSPKPTGVDFYFIEMLARWFPTDAPILDGFVDAWHFTFLDGSPYRPERGSDPATALAHFGG